MVKVRYAEEGFKEYLASKIVSVMGLLSIGVGLILKEFGIFFIGFGVLMLLTGVYFYYRKF